jgi:hypothetical protein
MAVPSNAEACCSCGARGLDAILDLGPQPDPDWLLDPSDPYPAPEALVELVICSTCGLVQLRGPRPDGPRPAHGHAMTVPDSDPWVGLIERSLEAGSRVVLDVDGSSGLPAESLSASGRVVTGPIPEGAAESAGLILVGHALVHADNFDREMRRIETALAPRGLVAIDFHHVLGLVQGQFDVVSHAHRSYLSLYSLERALDRYGLGVVAAQRIADYGGTVRVLAARRSDDVTLDGGGWGADRIRKAERIARIDGHAGYEGLEQLVHNACAELVAFLDEARRAGRAVVGYGAAARGTTLLNIAGVGVDRLPFVVDRAPAKQGRLLPRARIPILPPSEIERAKPDDIMILPWPLAGQIADQLAYARDWGARCFVALPRLEILR